MLRKKEECYKDGDLVEELFSNCNKYIMSARGIEITSGHAGFVGKEDSILFKDKDVAFFRRLEAEWKREAKALAGYIAHGHAFCGCIGATYYPPFSEEGTRLNKEEYSRKFKRDKRAGLVSKRFSEGGLEVDIERFEVNIYKGNAALVLKTPLKEVFDAFQTYSKRKHLYK